MNILHVCVARYVNIGIRDTCRPSVIWLGDMAGAAIFAMEGSNFFRGEGEQEIWLWSYI
jgi:hypothetical protein